MTISMFKASAPIFVQFLTSLSAILDKAAAHAEAKKIEPSVLLNTRLYPDMFPLVRQVRAATDHAISACGRLAGVELPTFANTESSILELKERIARAIEFIKSINPAQIDGSEDKEITIKFSSGERKFTGQSLYSTFVCPTFISTPLQRTTYCGIAVSRLASATSWEHQWRCRGRSWVALFRPDRDRGRKRLVLQEQQ